MIAIGLLIVFHAMLSFTWFAPFVAFVQVTPVLDGLGPGMGLLNVWRIPILFVISGMGGVVRGASTRLAAPDGGAIASAPRSARVWDARPGTADAVDRRAARRRAVPLGPDLRPPVVPGQHLRGCPGLRMDRHASQETFAPVLRDPIRRGIDASTSSAPFGLDSLPDAGPLTVEEGAGLIAHLQTTVAAAAGGSADPTTSPGLPAHAVIPHLAGRREGIPHDDLIDFVRRWYSRAADSRRSRANGIDAIARDRE